MTIFWPKLVSFEVFLEQKTALGAPTSSKTALSCHQSCRLPKDWIPEVASSQIRSFVRSGHCICRKPDPVNPALQLCCEWNNRLYDWRPSVTVYVRGHIQYRETGRKTLDTDKVQYEPRSLYNPYSRTFTSHQYHHQHPHPTPHLKSVLQNIIVVIVMA